MTDLEMTRLCAEAMGLQHFVDHEGVWLRMEVKYDPLHNDAQAMALVKKFRLVIDRTDDGRWMLPSVSPGDVVNADLNRAICECVAKMQAAKVTA